MKNWKNKFILLALGQAVSMLTSSILQFAIVWHLTQRTGSPLIVTLSTLAGFLPRAILGLFSGVLIDRFDRKKILMMSDMAIAFAAFLLSAVAFLGKSLMANLCCPFYPFHRCSLSRPCPQCNCPLYCTKRTASSLRWHTQGLTQYP